MKQVRGSEIQDFLRCRLRWKYRWIDGLKAKKPNGKLFIGQLLHKFLEVLYVTKSIPEAQSAMTQLFNETDTSRMEQVELDDLWELATKISNNYVEQWQRTDQEWNVIATELNFLIPIDADVAYEGTIDVVYLDKNDQLKFMDHKFVSSIDRYDKNIDMDRQISRYWWALQKLCEGVGFVKYGEEWCPIQNHPIYMDIVGLTPAEFVYNIILKDFPVMPEVLKKGGLSKDKSQKTTLQLYMQALKNHGLYSTSDDGNEIVFPNEYQGILNHLAQQETEYGNRFFRRVPIQRTQEEINAAISEFHATALDALKLREIVEYGYMERIDSTDEFVPVAYNPIYRNITLDCSWDCEFKALCHGSMDGSNVDLILNLMYEREEEV